jgi:Tol biopolymer transport system component
VVLGTGVACVLALATQLARATRTGPTVPNDSQPYWSGDTRLLAFQREAPGSGVQDVYTVRAVGGPARWLGPSIARGWRPGGGGLLVEYNGRTAIFDRGGAPTGGVDGVDATWSPAGGRIAYLDGDALDVADATGGHVVRIAGGVHPPSWDTTGPVWSPDGDRIAISSSDGFGDSFIVTVAVDGSERGRRVFFGPNQNVNPTWSPDGRTIAFESNAGRHWSIWEVRADGSGGAVDLSNGSYDDRFPEYSPVSGRLAWISDRQRLRGGATPYRYALYVVGSDGLTAQKLVDDVRPDSPARWSPSGAQLAVAAGRECRRWGIYVVRAEGGGVRRLSNLCRFEGTPRDDVLHGTPYPDFVRGLAGNDLIVGGAGRDRIWAGSGDDRIEARDGDRDAIDCGSGRDVARVDRLDVVHGCERVLRP